MAISFGTALLAAAGGAAQKGNQILDEGRAARTKKLSDRYQQMLSSRGKEAETKFSEDYKGYAKRVESHNTWGSVDFEGNVAQQKRALTGALGFSEKDAKALVNTSEAMAMFKKLKQAPGERPSMSTSELEGATSPDAGAIGSAERLREMFSFGNKASERAEAAAAPHFKEMDNRVGKARAEGVEVQAQADAEAEEFKSVGDDLFAPEDTVNVNASDTVVRLTAQVENAEAALALDRGNPKLIRRLENFTTELNNELEQIGRTDADLELKFRLPRQIESVNNKIVNATGALEELSRFAALRSPGRTGIAGAVGSVKASITNAVEGIAELVGIIDPRLISAQLQALEDANLTQAQIDKMDGPLLHGMSQTAKIRLIYAVASTFKEEGRKNVNNIDIAFAADILGKGATEIDVGRVLALQNGLERNILAANKQGYQLVGVGAKEKAQYGNGWMRQKMKSNPELFVAPDGSEEFVRGKHWAIGAEGTVWFATGKDLQGEAISLDDFLALQL
jgi:hypothetical protein